MWTVVLAIIGAVAIGNALLTVALVTRMRALQELVEERLGMNGDLMQPGEAPGSFSAKVLDGDTITAASFASGTTLVGFFTPGCEKCDAAKQELLARPVPWPVVAFIEGSEADPTSLQIARDLSTVARPVFVQHDDDATRAFRISGYPTLVRVTDGKVAIAGRSVPEVMV